MSFSMEIDGMYVIHWALHVCCGAAVIVKWDDTDILVLR